MFTCNYHTHTYRCGHATGKDEDYVLEAIGKGFTQLGFSDHAMLPDFSEPYTRGDFSLFEDYGKSIRFLKQKYAKQITLFLGFEAESFPQYFPFFQELLGNKVLDYLILGNHSAMNEKREIVHRFSRIHSASELYLYRDLAVQALSSGLYSLFAHPDYFLSSIDNFDSDCKKVSRDLIECAIANDIPLEINLAGIRHGKRKIGTTLRWIYPTDDFFSLVHRYKAKCYFGQDAHAPNQLGFAPAQYEATLFARKHDLIVLDRIEKISPKHSKNPL